MGELQTYYLNLWSVNSNNDIWNHYKLNGDEFGLLETMEISTATPKVESAKA